VDLRLNEPRFVKLPDIIKAKKKPLDTIDPASLALSLQPRFQVLSYSPPPVRQKGRMVGDVAELLTCLVAQGLVK
jgi:electron transfer flavoprotein beta subunit